MRLRAYSAVSGRNPRACATRNTDAVASRLNPRLRVALPGGRARRPVLLWGFRARPIPRPGVPACGAAGFGSALSRPRHRPARPVVGLVGRSGPFRAGRLVAGAAVANPLWCGLVLGPSLFRSAGRCRSRLRCLGVSAQPDIKIFPPAGVPPAGVRPPWGCCGGPGWLLCVLLGVCPAPPWTRPVRGGWVRWGLGGPAPCAACPPRVGMPPRQVWRVVSRTRRPARPWGRGRPVRCGFWRPAVGGPRRPCGRQWYTESTQCWSAF